MMMVYNLQNQYKYTMNHVLSGPFYGKRPTIIQSIRISLVNSLLIMKLIAVLLIVSCVQLKAAALYGQTITINQRNVSMETIFESIREQTGYNFLFVDGAVPADDKFTVNEQGELKHVLSSLLHKNGLTNPIQDTTILR